MTNFTEIMKRDQEAKARQMAARAAVVAQIKTYQSKTLGTVTIPE
jgi:hypothetical protein